MRELKELCANCQVCAFMEREEAPRLYSDYHVEKEGETPPILVVDSAANLNEMKTGILRSMHLLDKRPFTYTQVVRCSYDDTTIVPAHYTEALQRCAVWTHHLTDNRMVVLAVPTALAQLKVKREHKPGDMFRSVRLGTVLCIPPLHTLDRKSPAWAVYETKVKRVLEDAEL